MNQSDPLDFLGFNDHLLDNKRETIEKLKLIIKIRWFVSPFVFCILTLTAFIGLSYEKDFSLIPLLINTSIILSLNFIYKGLLKKGISLRPLVYFQLFLDALHFTLSVYQTGGASSPFAFLYFGVIMASAILISGPATIITAGISAGLYSAVVVLELSGLLVSKQIFIHLSGLQEDSSFVIFSWLFNVFAFFAIAFLSNYLSSAMRKQAVLLKKVNTTLHRKVKIFTLLYKTSEALDDFTSTDDYVDHILYELLHFLRLDRALLYMVENDRVLKLYKEKHKEKKNHKSQLSLSIPLKEGAGLTALTALRNEAVNIKDPEQTKEINKKLAKKVGMNPFAMAPLSVNKKVIGVLGIDRNKLNGAIDDEEFKILKIFANQAAFAIAYKITHDV